MLVGWSMKHKFALIHINTYTKYAQNDGKNIKFDKLGFLRDFANKSVRMFGRFDLVAKIVNLRLVMVFEAI